MKAENVTNDTEIKPGYYEGNGGDLFDHFEKMFNGDQFGAFLVMNIFKYLYRFQGKAGLEDLIKARTYLNRLISLEIKEQADE